MEKKDVKVVNINQIESFTFPGGLRVRRLITKKRESSNRLMLGIATMDPGESLVWTYEDKDEVYYIVRGKIALQWDGQKVEAKEGDAVFLPMGWNYTVKNSGTEPVMIVYVLSPPAE